MATGTSSIVQRPEVHHCSSDSAGVTQLVESLPSKQVVAGSSPVPRSKLKLPSY